MAGGYSHRAATSLKFSRFTGRVTANVRSQDLSIALSRESIAVFRWRSRLIEKERPLHHVLDTCPYSPRL